MSKGLFEPDDRVSLRVVRAERVLPGDIYWGTEMSKGQPRKGFVIEAEGVPVPLGAVPVVPRRAASMVRVGSYHLDADALVLVQDLGGGK